MNGEIDLKKEKLELIYKKSNSLGTWVTKSINLEEKD